MLVLGMQARYMNGIAPVIRKYHKPFLNPEEHWVNVKSELKPSDIGRSGKNNELTSKYNRF